MHRSIYLHSFFFFFHFFVNFVFFSFQFRVTSNKFFRAVQVKFLSINYMNRSYKTAAAAEIRFYSAFFPIFIIITLLPFTCFLLWPFWNFSINSTSSLRLMEKKPFPIIHFDGVMSITLYYLFIIIMFPMSGRHFASYLPHNMHKIEWQRKVRKSFNGKINQIKNTPSCRKFKVTQNEWRMKGK